MHALRYDLSGEVGQPLKKFHYTSLPEIEWFYGEGEIGLCGWPVPLQHCFLRHLWTQNDPIVIEKSPDARHDIIRRVSEEGGFMGGPAYGVEEIGTLVNFLEALGTVHIYRAHLPRSSAANNLIVFGRNSPDNAIYTAPTSIEIRLQEQSQGGALLQKLLKRSEQVFQKRENLRRLVYE